MDLARGCLQPSVQVDPWLTELLFHCAGLCLWVFFGGVFFVVVCLCVCLFVCGGVYCVFFFFNFRYFFFLITGSFLHQVFSCLYIMLKNSERSVLQEEGLRQHVKWL